MPDLIAAGVSVSGEVALALIELGAIMLALGAVARIAHRLRISAVPLYLAVGVLLGLGPGPLELGDETIELGAAVGVALLLFFIGLEYTGRELLATLRQHRASGFVDAALNAVPGLAIGLVIGLDWTGSAALAGITWISSSGIVSRTLDDLGRLGNRETPSILAILVIEDLAMAAYLPILTVALVGGGLAAAAESLSLAAAVVAVVLALALRLPPREPRSGHRAPRGARAVGPRAHIARRGARRAREGLLGGRRVPCRHRPVGVAGRPHPHRACADP